MRDCFISEVTDHNVTQQTFLLVWNKQRDMLITQPVPTDLAPYYVTDKYISHQDEAQSLFQKLYQCVKKITIRQKGRLLSRKVRKGALLDVGAGTGEFLQHMQQLGWDALGFEPGNDAHAKAKSKGLHLLDSLRSLPESHFSAITLWHVLEHIPELEDHFKLFHQALQNGGLLLIAVPNFKSYDAQHYGRHWAAYDVPRHLWHFSEAAMKRLALEHGFVFEGSQPMWFDSFYVSLLSEQYQTGKMNFVKAFLIGLYSNLKAVKNSEYSSKIYFLRKV